MLTDYLSNFRTRGAKTALTLALHSPALIQNVVAIDNCPIERPLSEDFPLYLEGMARVKNAQVKSHSEADEILKEVEKVYSIHTCYSSTPGNITELILA